MKFEYENGIRDKKTITQKANDKVREFGQPKLLGVKHSEEHNQKIRDNCKGINLGENNGMFDKKPWNKQFPTKVWWAEKEFKKLRELCLLRDKGKCKKCSASILKKQLYCDHIVPYRICKEHKLENLQILCGGCHAKKTGQDLRDYSELRKRM